MLKYCEREALLESDDPDEDVDEEDTSGTFRSPLALFLAASFALSIFGST